MGRLTGDPMGLPGVIAVLGRRLVAREARRGAVGGRRLGAAVVQRRRPKRLAASTRLAPSRQPLGGSIVRTPIDSPPVERPQGMSEFAAQWLFGDDPPEGIPFGDGAALEAATGVEDLPAAEDSPAAARTYERSATSHAAPQSAATRSGGRIEEGPRLRLSGKPAPRRAAAQPVRPGFEDAAKSQEWTYRAAGGSAGERSTGAEEVSTAATAQRPRTGEPIAPGDSNADRGSAEHSIASPTSSRMEPQPRGVRRQLSAQSEPRVRPEAVVERQAGAQPKPPVEPRPPLESSPATSMAVPLKRAPRVSGVDRPTVRLQRAARQPRQTEPVPRGGSRETAARPKETSASREAEPLAGPRIWRRIVGLLGGDGAEPDHETAAQLTAPSDRSPLSGSRGLDRFGAPATGGQAHPGPAEGPVSEARGSSPRSAGGQMKPPRPARPDRARIRPQRGARPPIRLPQRADSVQRDESDPAPPPLSGTASERLALAAGATLLPEADDQATVVFPPPGGRGAPMLARSQATPSAPLARTTPATGFSAPSAPPPASLATVSPAPPAPAPASPSPSASMDDVYEQVLERLRRDLLTERERMGDLLGELP